MPPESDEPQTLPQHDNSSDVSKLYGSCRYDDVHLLNPLRSPVALCASSNVIRKCPLHIGDPSCEDDRHGSRFSSSLVAVVAGRRLLRIFAEILYWECCQRAASELNPTGYVYKSYPREFGGDIILLQDEPWHRSGLVRRRLPPQISVQMAR